MRKVTAEPTGERLSKRVMALRQCSRSEAERYIAGGWVRVNGVVVEDPPHRVHDETVTIDPKASLLNLAEATFVLHKPEGMEDGTRLVPPADDPRRLLQAGQRSAQDRHGERLLKRHLAGLQVPVPLEYAASGLLVFTQDWRVLRKLSEDQAQMEHEFIVDVQGQVSPDALLPIARALREPARGLPDAKVSVGEDDAGEICTTPAGAVTEVTMGMDTELMMPPMMAGVFFRSTNWRAWSTATEPWLWASRRSKASLQPAMPALPAALFKSLNANSTDLLAACP